MTVDSRQIVDQYLRSLEEELGDLSPADRAEIILEFREHFEDARRDLQDPTEADLRNIVERLGPPAEIAGEARQRLGVAQPKFDSQAAALPPTAPRPASAAGPLEIAALVLWVAWWPLGLVLMALSPRWTRRIKATAMAIELGFVAILLGLFITPIYFTSHASASHAFVLVPYFLLFPPSVLGIAGAAYLTWKLASPAFRIWSTPWRAAGRIAGVIVGAWLLWVLVLGPLTLLFVKGSGA